MLWDENEAPGHGKATFEEKGALRQSCGRMLAIGVAEVMLVSGRCCCQMFDLFRFAGVTGVLRECAHLLSLDEDKVLESGTLLQGTRAITHLSQDLEAGKIHEVTLVMA